MRSRSHHTYHMVLRSSAVLLMALLVFDSGVLSPLTKHLSDNALNYAANIISVGAGVAPNELNTITAELTKKRTELDERERALKDREMAIGLATDQSSSRDISTYVLSALLFIILVLITLNYALDFVRERRRLVLQPSYE